MAIAVDWGGVTGTANVSFSTGNATITSGANPWLSTDVGKTIWVNAAGPGGAVLKTYIAVFNNAGSVDMATTASYTSSDNAWWFVGQYELNNPITSLTWKHVCSGANRYLVVPVWTNDATFPDGCTYNGAAMTMLDSYRSNDKGAQLWGLAAPALGTYDVVLTYSGSAIAYAGTSVSYTGVHQSVSVGTPAHAYMSGTTISVNVTSAVGELVVDCLATSYKAYTITATGTGQVIQGELYAQTGNLSGNNGKLDTSSTTGAATTTVSYTSSGTNYGNITAIPLKPAGVGTDYCLRPINLIRQSVSRSALA